MMKNRRSQNESILSTLKNDSILTPTYIFIPDLACAAALISMNFPLRDVDTSNAQKIKFAFFDTSETQECVRSYFEGTLRVDPRGFFDNIKMLKTRIHIGGKYDAD